jgi:hypothetical protein
MFINIIVFSKIVNIIINVNNYFFLKHSVY